MRKKVIIPIVISSILLITAVFPIGEYGYYVFLRWVVFLTAIYIEYLFIEHKRTNWEWVIIIIAILFNPIIPIHLNKELWQMIDIIVAILLIITIFKANVDGRVKVSQIWS